MVGRLLNNFCQYFPWILHIAGGICVRFSKKKIKILKISPTTVAKIYQNLRGVIRNYRNISIPKRDVQLDNLLKTIDASNLNSH